MDNLSLGLIFLAGFLVAQSFVLLALLNKAAKRITETNKQLLLLVAGKEAKPEALRALVASARPPQGNLKGIGGEKKDKKDKPMNTNYTMSIGI